INGGRLRDVPFVCSFYIEYLIYFFTNVDSVKSPIPIKNNNAGSVIRTILLLDLGTRAYEYFNC
ncbi:MAG: hypothetical protein PVH97_04020, partial [Desulfobacterales bacterium]